MKPLLHPAATGAGQITISIRLDRAMLVAAMFSILIHALLLMATWKRLMEPVDAIIDAPPLVMQLDLAKPLIKPEKPAPQPAAEPPPVAPEPRHVRRQPRPAPKVMTTENSSLHLPVEAPPSPLPAPSTPAPTPAPGTPTDLLSYMNAMRERRRQNEENAARENAMHAARERLPTEDERRNELIKRNLQAGTNGIFQIVNIGAHSAQFTFKGWTTDSYNARREFIQVEADVDEDIQRKIVQKMIEIIRRHYSGDFNWESQRLDRVVVLSARREDNDGLEDFLIAEFFGGRR